eukprot:TRINITY_DN479_c1_g1_i1.p1 TRINITY_DN479_c1_g1~~TRINITY_DN479_c1_g1_i1.p1  ORF type:complete len:785 (+),score=176.86 TRINITY_DN479_c1_g1_i1:2486-4840(+)
MTDRLGELRPTAVSDADDVEAGLDAAAEAQLAAFNRKADAIEKVFVWADRSIRTITNDLQDPDALPSITAQLDTIDNKLDAVRKHLRRIADENRQLAASAESSPATLRIRVNRFTKLSKDFMAITTQMETVRETHREVVKDGVKRDILAANPHASERQVERALQAGDLESVLVDGDVHLHHQIEDLRSRNQDIQKLSKNIVELHNMFTDMSLLVENQQELINGIEYNVKEVHQNTKKAAEELVIARNHQVAARKKKACCIITVIVIVLAVVGGIIIWQGIRNNWFGGGGDNNNNAVVDTASGANNTARRSVIRSASELTMGVALPEQQQQQQQRRPSGANPPPFVPPHLNETFRRAQSSIDSAQLNVDRILQSVGNFLRDMGVDGPQDMPQPPTPPPMPSWAPSPPPFRHPPPPPRHRRGRYYRRRGHPFGMFGMRGMGGAGGMGGMSATGLGPMFATIFSTMADCGADGTVNVSQPTRDAFEQLKTAVMNSDNTQVAFQAARNAFPALRNWLIANLGGNGPLNAQAIDSLITTVERSIRPSVGDDITNRTTHLLRTALNDQAVVDILRIIPWNMDLPVEFEAGFNSASSAPINDMPFQTHVNVECDSCDVSPIVGARYRATNRDDYDICEKCYEDPAVSKEGIEFKKLTYIWEASVGDAKAPAAPLSLRSRGPSVAFLQKLLTDLGYMNESMYRRVVGMYGPRTRTAVSQFQREYGLEGAAQLGVYDDITAASLTSILEAQVPPTAATGGATATTPATATNSAQDSGSVAPTNAPDASPPAQG